MMSTFLLYYKLTHAARRYKELQRGLCQIIIKYNFDVIDFQLQICRNYYTRSNKRENIANEL